MTRLLATTKLDMTVQLRNNLYTIAVGMAVLLGLALYFFMPREYLPVFLPLFYLFSIGGTAYIFVAGMVIFEKGEHTLDAQIVSPLRVNEYLLAKVISLLIVVLLESLIVVLIAYGFREVNWLLFLAGVVLMSVGLTLGGFIQVSRYKSVTEFILPASVILLILQLPWLGLSGLVPSYLWYLVPTTAPTLLITAAFEPIATWEIVYGVTYSVGLIALLFWWARRAFYNNLILRAG